MILLDKLRNKIKYNKRVMLFLSIIVIIGITTGSFLSVILNSNDKLLISSNIKDFIDNITNLNYFDIFKNTIIINIILILGIWLLGISVIGLIIVILLVFWKAFTLGFTISGFILTYNLKGLLLAFIYIFPHIIINLLVIMYLGSYALKFSILIIRCIFNKVNLDLRKLMIIYFKVLIISLFVIIITSLFEAFITPYLLKFIISLTAK